MDFGATQCTPQSPLCLLCPFMEDCEAHRRGIAEELPVKLKKTKITTRHLIYIYVRTQGYTAIHRRGAGDIWQGLWEPPLFEDQCLPHILMADFYLLDTDVRPSLPEDYIWVPETQLGDYAVPRLVEKLLAVIA